MHEQALREYQQTRIETGSPVRLVSMLYDGALRFIAEARAAIEAQDIPVRADRIRRAMSIVQELRNALEYSVDSDLPLRLAALYEYVEYELLEATTHNQVAHLDNATRVLDDLARAWRQLADTYVPPEYSSSEATEDVAASEPDTAAPPAVIPTDDGTTEESERHASLSLSA